MKTEVLTIGPRPTLILDGRRVARADGRITLEAHTEGSGYPTSLTPQSLARHLLKYAKGEPGWPKHSIEPELRKRLSEIASGANDAAWVTTGEAAAMMGFSVKSLQAMRARKPLRDINAMRRGKALAWEVASIRRWLAARDFSSGFSRAS